MKMIHVLSIGNSFSADAHTYLHDLAASEGVQIETVNLYIGGCSLDQHFRNMCADKHAYTLEINGHHAGGFFVSLTEALTARNWDVITLQQASHFSYLDYTYHPYISRLAEYVRGICPHARLLLHQTWAYESGSSMIQEHGFQTYDEMFAQVKACYTQAASCIGADGIIPSGEALQYALSHGLDSAHRDSFHAKRGIGRFILALVWYGCITGRNVDNIQFSHFHEPVSEVEYQIALDAAASVLEKAKH